MTTIQIKHRKAARGKRASGQSARFQREDGCHFELNQAVMAMGFCPRCEWRHCECEGQYDD